MKTEELKRSEEEETVNPCMSSGSIAMWERSTQGQSKESKIYRADFQEERYVTEY